MNHLEVIFRLWKQPVTIGYHKCHQLFFICSPKRFRAEKALQTWLLYQQVGTQHLSPSEPHLGLFLETEQSVCGAFCCLIKGDLNWHVRGRDDIYINSISVHQAWIIFLHMTAPHFHCCHKMYYYTIVSCWIEQSYKIYSCINTHQLCDFSFSLETRVNYILCFAINISCFNCESEMLLTFSLRYYSKDSKSIDMHKLLLIECCQNCYYIIGVWGHKKVLS